MAAIARWYQDTDGSLATGGTGNTYTLTSNSSHAALGDQSFLIFRVDRANTGAATLNVDSLGAKSLNINGNALVSGDLVQDVIIIVVYNSTSDVYDIIGGALPDDAVSTSKIADEAVTFAKMQHISTDRLLGRDTASSGDVEQITLSGGIKFNGSGSVILDTSSTRNTDHSSVTITAGNGLSGGGTIESTRTLTVGAGTGITVGSTTVGLDTSNTRNVDHASVSITAGNGLTGGGTIASTRTINLDISGLSAMTSAPAGTDEFLYNDGGTMKTMSYNESATFSNTDSGAHTFTDTDVGGIRYYTGTGGDTWTMNSGTGQNNCWIMVVNSGSGNLTIASGSATVSSAVGLVVQQNGIAVLIRESSTQWFMGGTGVQS